MAIMLEESYRLGGLESWIHCLEFDFNEQHHIRYHYHEYVEFLFFHSGEGIVKIDEEAVPYKSETLIVVNSHRAHAIDVVTPSKYVCIKIMPTVLYASCGLPGEFKHALPFISESASSYSFSAEQTRKAKIRDLLSDIMHEWNSMSFGFELALRSKALDLFTRVVRQLRTTSSVKPTDYMTPEIIKALIYISNNFGETNETETARACGLSYNYFSYLFKKAVGKSFKDYLLDTRIYQSKKMLLSTDMAITEIAHSAGFCSSSHFISAFKAKTGITPSVFRRLYSS